MFSGEDEVQVKCLWEMEDFSKEQGDPLGRPILRWTP